jgi:hypothetical protein
MLSFGVLTGCGSKSSIDQGPAIEAPAALEEAVLSISVSDFPGFIDAVGEVASQVNPMMNSGMIKMLLGSNLGDPGLTGIAPLTGLAVVMTDLESFYAVVEVKSEQAASYVQTVQEMGLLAELQDGLLLVAMDTEQLAVAKQHAKTVQKKLLASTRDASLRVIARPAKLIAANEEQITGGLKEMLADMKEYAVATDQPVDVSKLLEAEVQVLLSLAGQVDIFEEVIAPVDGSINLIETLQPVAGSRLAAYCNAPAVNDYNPAIQSGLLEDGVFKLEACLRKPDAYKALIDGELKNLTTVMELDSANLDAWGAYIQRWFDAMGTTICESALTESQTFGISMIMDVSDEAAMLDALRSMPADLEALGLNKLYESLEMPMSFKFEEHVSTHADVAIHSLSLDLSEAGMSADEAAMMQAMMGDLNFDVAVFDGVVVYAGGEGAIEKIIDQVKSGAAPTVQLAARNTYPSGGMLYADLDVGGYIRFISKFAGQVAAVGQDLDPIVQAFDGAAPIIMSAYGNSGRMQVRCQIPSSLIERIAQMMMQM